MFAAQTSCGMNGGGSSAGINGGATITNGTNSAPNTLNRYFFDFWKTDFSLFCTWFFTLLCFLFCICYATGDNKWLLWCLWKKFLFNFWDFSQNLIPTCPPVLIEALQEYTKGSQFRWIELRFIWKDIYNLEIAGVFIWMFVSMFACQFICICICICIYRVSENCCSPIFQREAETDEHTELTNAR